MSLARLGLLWLALAVGPAGAQTIVTSPRPDRVAVTVYRDPDRDAAEPFNLAMAERLCADQRDAPDRRCRPAKRSCASRASPAA